MNAKLVLLVAIFGLLVGLASTQSRQIGGKDVIVQDYPFVVAITYLRELCGNGAIIQKRWIVSSASSFYNRPFSQYDVAVATDDFRGDATWHEVLNIYIHPEWVGFEHNIGLVKLVTEVSYSVAVQPISIATNDWSRPLDVTMLSYGKNEAGSTHLRAATYTLKTDQTCLQLLQDYNSRDVITLGHGYCLIPPAGTERGQYVNDAGAPVVKDNQLYGLFAFSENSGGVNDVSVATRVTFFTDWIESSIARYS
ncbi:serine protease SP24D-like [Anopheles nili]|uniref:serine protease SP24D-like n=1 Tax=Anopheles nili TaxID=185578 RepID=UPI00237C4D4F|nr:serine protease SP24D-like [Anopheles nili]